MSQMNLMTQRSFAGMFWTQFLGAFNDNFFKNALIILVTFKGIHAAGISPAQMPAICGAIFILPFFLFSATAGQLADKLPKHKLVQWVKLAEIGIMAIAAFGFLTTNVVALLAVLFLMGLHSAFFGPVKYGILPQLLEEDALVGANALFEMGTFIAILGGTIGGGLLIVLDPSGPMIVSAVVLVLAVCGYFTSRTVPALPAQAPDLVVEWDAVRPTWRIFVFTIQTRAIFLSVLGISWFWFFGAVMIALFPSYCQMDLHGDAQVATFLLALFSIGIAIGSLLCERLSRGHLELGLVPLGSIGMTLFTLDLFFAGSLVGTGALMGVGEFLRQPGAWRVTADLLLLAVFGGFYIVPLNTLIQQRVEPTHRSRVIAGNNIINSFFMVLSAGFLIGLQSTGANAPQIFLVVALMNLIVALYIYTLVPEFLYRFMCWVIANLMYRLRVRGAEHVPATGAAVLVCNHVSFIDWMIIASGCKRPMRFVMHYSFMKVPVMNWICKRVRIIPIASSKEDPEVLRVAFERIAEELDLGEIICIFPEGGLTKTGEMDIFRPGIEKILARNPVPVVPMALRGLWGGFFSRDKSKSPFRRLWSRIELAIGPSIAPEAATAAHLHDVVAGLRGDMR
jgi:1-acyl-sn-glycerol-3-phosphate acyltransferase